jgi:ankyrin repeat protein
MQLLLEMLAALDPDVALVDLTQEDLLTLLDKIVTDDDIWSKENAKNLFQSIMPEGLVSNRQSRLDCILFKLIDCAATKEELLSVLGAGASINSKDIKDLTPLEFAYDKSNDIAIQALVEFLDSLSNNSDLLPVLITAALGDDVETVQLILDKYRLLADMTEYAMQLNTLMNSMIEYDCCIGTVYIILEEYKLLPPEITKDIFLQTLVNAIVRKKLPAANLLLSKVNEFKIPIDEILPLLKELLDMPVETNVVETKSFIVSRLVNLLHAAAINGNARIVKLIVDQYKQLQLSEEQVLQALALAIRYQESEVIEVIVQVSQLELPSVEAAIYLTDDIVCELLVRNYIEENSMHKIALDAFGRNHQDLINMLNFLEYITPDIKHNILLQASITGNVQTILILNSIGINFFADLHHGMTAIILAALSRQYEVIDCILSKLDEPYRNQLINVQDKHGYTALDWAVSKGYGEIIKLLIEQGSDFTVYTTTAARTIKALINQYAAAVSLLSNDFLERLPPMAQPYRVVNKSGVSIPMSAVPQPNWLHNGAIQPSVNTSYSEEIAPIKNYPCIEEPAKSTPVAKDSQKDDYLPRGGELLPQRRILSSMVKLSDGTSQPYTQTSIQVSPPAQSNIEADIAQDSIEKLARLFLAAIMNVIQNFRLN